MADDKMKPVRVEKKDQDSVYKAQQREIKRNEKKNNK